MKEIYEKIEKSVLRIFEGLCHKISEDITGNVPEKTTIEDLEMKIDVIMDALGLTDKEDNDEDKKETKVLKTEEIATDTEDAPDVEFVPVEDLGTTSSNTEITTETEETEG
nr:MAG TPA: hypothetical protein [Caudoviricetes sp.]